ncbi:hypothetical protein SynA1825c_01399 [Synechococcus sp. A18-25c]|nr:hypothetical protein SynA1560_01416 [Synechococcus sp. A15-60]QNJ19705.1 hypothetical protein SynA1825c_01399 [Synechococcus sp. A18-25c]
MWINEIIGIQAFAIATSHKKLINSSDEPLLALNINSQKLATRLSAAAVPATAAN